MKTLWQILLFAWLIGWPLFVLVCMIIKPPILDLLAAVLRGAFYVWLLGMFVLCLVKLILNQL